MVSKVFKDVSEIIGDYSGLSRKVLAFAVSMKRLSDACKKPEFENQTWDRIFSEIFDTENFRRVGHLKEEMDYPAYIKFQTKWAPQADWECSFKRITEQGNVVIMELEERATVAGYTDVVNTVSVYEFNESGKLRYLDIYLQQTPPDPETVPEPYK